MDKLTKEQEKLLDNIALAETIEEFRKAYFEALQEVEPERRELITKYIIDTVNEQLKDDKGRS